MTKYVDKDALAAEINRLIKKNELHLDERASDEVRFQKTGAYSVLCDLRHFLDTLEVKEIEDLQGLEKEVAKDKNILILKKILSRFFESANANNEEFSKAIEDIENGLI